MHKRKSEQTGIAPALYSIRRLTAKDAEAYHALSLLALQETPTAFTPTYEEYLAFSLDWARDRLVSAARPHDFFLGAFNNQTSELVGMAGLTLAPRQQERHKATLWSVAVASRAQGQGIGRALVEQMLREASSIDGLLQVQLHVSADNKQAVRLYQQCGFVPFGLEPRGMMFKGQGVNKLHMVIMLDGCQWQTPQEWFGDAGTDDMAGKG